MKDNQLKSINGQISKNSLALQLQAMQTKGVIAFCFGDYRNGYENYDKQQFYAPFYIEFQNGEGWLLFSSHSIRNDRMNIQQWNSLHLKKIARNISRAYLVIPDETLHNATEKKNAENYQKKITGKMYSAIEDVCYQSEIIGMIERYAYLLGIIFSQYRPNCIPLYTLQAACGRFEDGKIPEIEKWVDVSGRGITPDKEQLFVVHAKGNSMQPKIKDGDLCVFEWFKGGSRNGEIVLTQCSEFDPEYDGKYTIKKYYSEKKETKEGWQHTKIELLPLNPDYQPIELDEAGNYRTIGILKFVL